jgi:PleD family two-component response regulator
LTIGCAREFTEVSWMDAVVVTTAKRPIPSRSVIERTGIRMLNAVPVGDEARVRVLVVDDDQTSLQTMEGVLADFDVVKCSSPTRAVELARSAATTRRPFDVVCSDFQMPMMNGVELLHHISLLEQQPS